MNLRSAIVSSSSLILSTLGPLHAQSTLVDWDQVWNYMHPTGGVLPTGSGATTPHPAGTTPWFATQATFAASYSGPSFTTGDAEFEAGSGAGPLGYGANDYMGNPLPPPAEFTALGTTLTTPASGLRYTGYFRTTFTVPNDGNIYSDPVIRYIFDDGGYIYLDGVLVLSVNMGAGVDDYLTLAANTANTESHIREGRLNLAPGSLTGGNDAVAPAIAGNAIVEQQIASLSPGVHTLAVALHNQANGSSDLLMAVQLRAGQADCLLDATVSNQARNTAGTSDPDDDTVGFTVNVVPTGTASASWEVSGPAGSSALGQGGSYNTGVQLANIPITEFGGGTMSLFIADSANPDCETVINLSPPRIIATDARGGLNLPIVTTGSTVAPGWVINDAARTLFMNNGGGGARQIVTSAPVDVSGPQAVLFTGVLQIDDTSSGNEDTDSFVAYLIIDGDTLNPINLITEHDTLVVDGVLTDDELAPGPGSFIREFSYIIPAAANSVQIVIEGINNSGSENFTVRDLRFSTDTDGDGMDDDYEDANGLDKTVNDAGLDPDGDGLTNFEEFQCGTDPQNADSDGDGLSDGEEKNDLGTNPLSDDTDGDGLTDNVETNTGIWVSASDTGTDPNDADSDGDGFADGVETNTGVFVSLTDPGTDPNKADTDGDGFGDRTEANNGSNPHDPASRPSVAALTILGTGTAALLGGDLTDPEDDGDDRRDPLVPGDGLAERGWNFINAVANEKSSFADHEAAFNIFDNKLGPAQDKWCCNARNITIEFAEGISLTHFTVSSANDVPNRDWQVWRLLGSTDGVDFDLIYENEGTDVDGKDGRLWTERLQVIRFDLPKATRPYAFFRFEADTNWGDGLWQVGEVELFGTVGKQQLFFDVNADGGNLVLTWESQGGELYNVRSETDPSNGEPATWPIFDGLADLEATPPLNTLTIPRPADPERFFVIEAFPAPPESIYSEDFESGQGEWTLGSDGAAGTAWQLGAPSNVGPSAANSPVNCFATNLSGDYAFDADIWLRSPAIDLTTAGSATLNYFEFRDIEEAFDFGTISVLDAADNSVLGIIDDTVDGVSTGWELVSKIIPAEGLGRIIKIEFRFTSDNIQNFPGWYVDDILVTVP